MEQSGQSYAGIFSNFVLLGIGIVVIIAVVLVVVVVLFGLWHVKETNPEKNMEPESAAEAGKPARNADSQHE
jgi:Na+-transporting methylmalonyl-CoA/oxaloacetate decarboxylase gamma subunit